MRHRRHNLNIAVGLDWIDQQVEFGGGAAVLTDDNLRVFFPRLDGHYAPASLAAHSVAMTGVVEVRQGIHNLGASRYGELTASRFLAKPDATVFRAEGEIGGVAGPVLRQAEGRLAAHRRPAAVLRGVRRSATCRSGGATTRRSPPAIAPSRASFELSTVPLPPLTAAAPPGGPTPSTTWPS